MARGTAADGAAVTRPFGIRAAIALAALLLGSCVGDGKSKAPVDIKTHAPYTSPVDRTTPGGRTSPANPAAPVAAPDRQLYDDLYALWQSFPGKTGIAVRRIDGGAWTLAFRGDELFPQQSVSKLWVALTILDNVDKGRISLNDRVEIGFDDLAVFYSPTRDTVVASGKPVTRTINELLQLALTRSDNTANDVLLWRAGGPKAVRDFIDAKGLGSIRFGPGERLLQSRIAGLEWKQSYSIGNRFFEARAQLPYDTRSRAIQAYLEDPYDGATPEAVTAALDKLARGELLSRASTAYVTDTLSKTRSGPNRLKAGVPGGWEFLHKTGTGQELGSLQTGYNDVGIMTAPDATRYAVAVMMADTTAGGGQRMKMMQEVARAVGRYHQRAD